MTGSRLAAFKPGRPLPQRRGVPTRRPVSNRRAIVEAAPDSWLAAMMRLPSGRPGPLTPPPLARSRGDPPSRSGVDSRDTRPVLRTKAHGGCPATSRRESSPRLGSSARHVEMGPSSRTHAGGRCGRADVEQRGRQRVRRRVQRAGVEASCAHPLSSLVARGNPVSPSSPCAMPPLLRTARSLGEPGRPPGPPSCSRDCVSYSSSHATGRVLTSAGV